MSTFTSTKIMQTSYFKKFVKAITDPGFNQKCRTEEVEALGMISSNLPQKAAYLTSNA